MAPVRGLSALLWVHPNQAIFWCSLEKVNAVKPGLQAPKVSAGLGFLLRDAEAQSGLGKMKFSSSLLPNPKIANRVEETSLWVPASA